MNRREFLVRSSLTTAAGAWLGSRLFAADAAPAPSPTPPAPSTPAGPPTGLPPSPKVEFKALRSDVGIAYGRGGTMGYLANADGLVAIDSAFPDAARMFLEGVPGRNGRKFDWLLNTHHHPDHTGGNATFKPHTKAIVAHDTVPELQRSRSRNPDAEVVADTLFAKEWKTQVGAETIVARHFGPAHTRGDSVIHFEKANVVHVGDLMFNHRYPVMDRAGGHTTKGWIAAIERLTKEFSADTIFIFGHAGPKYEVTGKGTDLLWLRDYLTAITAFVEKEKAAGKTKEEILVTRELPGFAELVTPGPNSGLTGNLGAIYDELAASG